MNPLDSIKGYLALAAAIVLSAGLVVQSMRLSHALADLAVEHAARESERAEAATAAASGIDKMRRDQAQTSATQQENIDALTTKLSAANAARAASDDSVRGMQRAITAFNTARRLAAIAAAGTTASGPAEVSADVVPADLYGWADGRARELAAWVDDGRPRGELCSADYDALRPAP